jgi:hypothetical protein
VIDELLDKVCKKYLVEGFHLEHIGRYREGVYAFFDKDHECLYVGETTDIKDRLKSHLKSKEFKDDIDYIKIFPMKPTLLKDKAKRIAMEAVFIDLLQPKYNIQNRGNSVFEEEMFIDKYEDGDWVYYTKRGNEE